MSIRTSSNCPSSPVSNNRVPSFRNSVDSSTKPRSLDAMRHYRRFNNENNEMPNILKYFRRNNLTSITQGNDESAYFLANTSQLQPPQLSEHHTTSNNSVIYTEVDMAPEIYCCVQHSSLARQNSSPPPPSYSDCMM